MAVKFVVLFACVALAAGMVRRDAPSALDDFNKNAKEVTKTFSESINSVANSKNTQEVNKALKEGADSILQHLSLLSDSIQKEIADANTKTKEALEKSKIEIQKATDDLRKAHPDVEQNAEKVRQELQKAVNSAITGAQNIAKEVAGNVEETSKKLSPQITTAFDDFVKQTKAVEKKLHEAANKKQ